jgi:hypothetical protein
MVPELVSQGCDGKSKPTGEIRMTAPFAVTVLLLVALIATPDAAQAQREGPWCAYIGIGDDSYVERCDMLSYEMCRSEIFAQGGAYCTQNPRYKAATPSKQQRKTKRRSNQ